MTEEKRTSLHPISETLRRTYQLLASRERIPFDLNERSIEALDSIVKTVHSNYYGKERYASPAQKAAAYFYYLIKDHPLTDGNKRLAILWFTLITATQFDSVELHDRETGNIITLDELAVSVEKSDEEHDATIAKLAELFSSITYIALPKD